MLWPSLVVPAKNSTFWTFPSLSLAVALIVMSDLNENVEPLAGAVIWTVGGEPVTF